MRLGIVGVGRMGGNMARAVLGAGRPLVVHDVDVAAVEELVALGATAASTPVDLARQVDVAAVVVIDDLQVKQVVAGGTDAVWAIHSTVSPATIHEVAQRATVLDAPVAGGHDAAGRGEVAIMIGGDAAVLERVRDAFSPYAGLIMHMGPLGAGQRTKLIKNLMTYTQLALADEVRSLIAESGIDHAAFAKVLVHADRTTPAYGGLLQAEPWLAGVDARIPHKDLRACIALARELGVAAPIAELVDARIEHALRGR
ncbi:MAG: NAD(P)-dependent oxidoreductase [Gammaproteobacteria bacterium]